MEDWLDAQTEAYVCLLIVLPLFVGFLIGCAVALATGAWLVGALIGIGVWLWCLIICIGDGL